FGDHVSTASNAELTVNGVDIERDSNTITDAIDGITLTLAAPTAGVSSISVQQDKTGVESRLRALVEAYNSLETTFDMLADPDGADDQAGVFSGSTSFRMIRSNIRSLITNASTTPTDNLTYLSDIGIQFSRTGFLEIDEDRLSTALDENFSEIVTLLSADTNNQSTYDDAARGLAGEALLELDALMASDGTVLTNTNSLEDRVKQYAIELEDLDRRMTKINQRYLMQFTAMETAIDEMNSLREYLDQQLSALPFTNKNNN
ncbi:flagellar filament capping protein FliD, partial [Litoricolaceae bacterium]|nr:flagellar filament capping protein FliD [Litorivicinaceae bacterium]